jgi:hypothetical protein
MVRSLHKRALWTCVQVIAILLAILAPLIAKSELQCFDTLSLAVGQLAGADRELLYRPSDECV